MKLTNVEILNKYSNMDPGKYWSLPDNKKHLIDQYMENENYFPMVKMDGCWARVIITDGQVLIQSRGISKKTGTYGDYTPLVPHIAAELLERYPDGTVLLGELAYPELNRTANEVGSILRCLPKKAVERQKEDKNKLQLFVFDVLVFNGEEIINKSFSERYMPKYSLGNNPTDAKYVRVPMSSTPSAAKEMLEWVWSQGGEGIILINNNMPYNIGNAKAWHSIKVKREMSDVEGVVTGVIAPTKIYEGKDLETWKYFVDANDRRLTMTDILSMKDLGDIIPVTKPYYFNRAVGVTVNYNGKVVNITSGTTEEDGEYLMTPEAQALISAGKMVAVFTGMEETADSVRHPRLIRLRDEA